MSSMPGYQRLPQRPADSKPTDGDNDSGQGAARVDFDPRFYEPTPSPWKRAALLVFVALLFWLAYSLRRNTSASYNIVHAQRYSKEHKFRPAASPIITERLKDGRVRLRGAHPTLM